MRVTEKNGAAGSPIFFIDIQSADMAATEAIFSTLMGEDVEGRRKFIEENALDVRNLDI